MSTIMRADHVRRSRSKDMIELYETYFLCPRRQVARVSTIKRNASGSHYVTLRLVSRNSKNVYKRRAESSRHVHLRPSHV